MNIKILCITQAILCIMSIDSTAIAKDTLELKKNIIAVHTERLAIIRSVDEALLEELISALNKIATIKKQYGIFGLCKEQQGIFMQLRKSPQKGKTNTQEVKHFKILAQKMANIERQIHPKIQPLQDEVHRITQSILVKLTDEHKRLLQSKGKQLVDLRSQLREIQPCALADDQEGLLGLLFM